jgi:murein DD-endopeptidase MepM/ murein hydrolase activator NlpD
MVPRDHKTLRPVRSTNLHRLCLAAAVLPAACATALPAGSASTPAALPAPQVAPTVSTAPTLPAPLAPPVAPAAPTTEGAQALVALVRIADALEVPFADRALDQLVRWQHDLRDRLHGIEAGLTALAQQSKRGLPDVTVLTVEPVAHTESSGFGWRDDPIRHTRSFHAGTDFRGQPGTSVVAAGDGIVAYSGRLGGYGNVVDIDHGGGVVTRYAHLRKIETHKAQAVRAGDTIGRVGSTGRTTGPHLHFEVRIDGAPVSPIAAMAIASLQREFPIAGRLAALSLAPELQANAESDVDPPKQRARSPQHPERAGRGKRQQVLW